MLNVKQLKELLVRNRVEYRGCLERRDLLERAKTLWRNHAQYKDGKITTTMSTVNIMIIYNLWEILVLKMARRKPPTFLARELFLSIGY